MPGGGGPPAPALATPLEMKRDFSQGNVLQNSAKLALKIIFEIVFKSRKSSNLYTFIRLNKKQLQGGGGRLNTETHSGEFKLNQAHMNRHSLQFHFQSSAGVPEPSRLRHLHPKEGRP